ncbi:MAG: helix-turn-helix domain-containing protein [Magnetococcales bacterium]|nr:helix-turn-helix domain-containing protein [Magnetococcales bacterium]
MSKKLSDRILQARQNAELTQRELARRVGISLTTVYNLEHGKALYSRRLVTIAIVCGVQPAWLESGRGEMLLSAVNSVFNTKSCRDISPIFAQIPMISLGIINVLNSWNDHDQIMTMCDELLPVLPRNKGQHYGLRVPDDSMEPDFYEGEIIVVDSELAATNNHFVIARLGDESHTTFKQLVIIGDKKYLRPSNPRYPIIEVEGELEVFGVVVCKYKEYLYFGQ